MFGRYGLETFRERWTFDQFEHERLHAVRFLEAIDCRDVGMIERGEHLRFTLEPRHALGIVREGARQDLQRDVAIELRVAGAEHFAHPACPERGTDFIRADSGSGLQ